MCKNRQRTWQWILQKMRLLCSMSTGHQYSVKLLICKLLKKMRPGWLGKSTLPCNAGNSKRLYWMRYLRNKMSLRLTNPRNVKEMCRWYGIIYEIKKRCWKFNISFSCRRPESNFTSVYKTKEIRGFLQPFQPSTNILQTVRKIIFQLLLRKFGNTKGGFITMNSYQDRKLIPRPTPKPYNEMTEAELQHVLATAINHNQLIPALIEANRRKDEQIHYLSKSISALEVKSDKESV